MTIECIHKWNRPRLPNKTHMSVIR
jgi:hypothetical protein